MIAVGTFLAVVIGAGLFDWAARFVRPWIAEVATLLGCLVIVGVYSDDPVTCVLWGFVGGITVEKLTGHIRRPGATPKGDVEYER